MTLMYLILGLFLILCSPLFLFDAGSNSHWLLSAVFLLAGLFVTLAGLSAD